MKKIIILLFMILSMDITAQESTISGRITDINTGEGISNVLVSIKGLNSFSYTDYLGSFSLITDQPDNDPVILQIRHLGYESNSLEVTPDNHEINISLTPSTRVMEEILVKTNRQHTITSKDLGSNQIMKKNPKDVGDIFSDVSGFGIIKRGAYAMDPVLRSFKYEQINLIYDGGVYVSNACPNRMDPASTHVSPAEIDRIEIIKGPYSVRYGQTMGGIVNIITFKPEQSDDSKFHGVLEGGYELNGNGISGRGVIMTSGKKADLMVQGGLQNFSDYKNGNGDVIPSAFKTYDYAIKAGYMPKNNQRLQLNWRQSFGRDIKHAALPMDLKTDNSSIISLDYVIRNLTPKLITLNSKAYFSYVDHLMTNEERPNLMMVEAESPVTSHTFGGRFELGIMPGKKTTIFTGIDLRSVAKDGERHRLVKIMNGNPLDPPRSFTDLIWQDSWMHNAGIFIESDMTINEKVEIVLGARADIVSSGIHNPAEDFEELYGTIDNQSDFNTGITGSISYAAGKQSLFQLSAGRGQRSPELLERYINHFNIGMDAYEYVGNPFLEPEVNNQVDFTYTGKTGRFGYRANVFYSYLQHYITAVVDENLPRKFMPGTEPQYAKRFINIDKAWQTGFDADISYQVTHALSAHLGAYYTKAQNVDFDEPLPEIPPFTGLLSLQYKKQHNWIEFKGRFVSKQSRVAESFNETESPGFNVFDLLAGFSPVKNIHISVSLKNIFNANYYEHLSRPYKNLTEEGMFYEPGRQLRFGAKFEF